MGQDDDADCVEHVWQLTEVTLSMPGASMTSTCVRCGAERVEPAQGIPGRRPPVEYPL